ncbi:MAG: ABC transporter ATP-binding protein [Chlamydiia bacterium]|nr:ABC transporter ATP-binding protein [Chlamydiia bacterium]
MKLLVSTVLKRSQHRSIFLLTLVAMCFLTLASQLEIFTLGVIAHKGSDFFELFAPIKNQQLQSTEEISWENVEERWRAIPRSNSDKLTRAEAQQFIETANHKNVVGSVMAKMKQWIPIHKNFYLLAAFITLVAFFKAITLFTHRYCAKLIAIRVSRDLRERYFQHLQTLPMTFYQKYDIGTLSSRVVGDATMIADSVNACLVNFFQTPFTVLTTLIICFLTSWQLSLMIFVGFPLIAFPIMALARKVKKLSKQVQQNQEKFSGVLLDFIAGIQTVKVFAMEGFSLNKYREFNNRMAKLEQKSARYDVSTRPIVHTIGMFLLSLALVWGLFVLHMDVAEVLFYCGLMWVFYEPIKKFAEENSQIQRGVAAAERMEEVMQIHPQIFDSPTAIALKAFTDSITFANVWFRYEEEWVLQDLSFTARKGEMVAIVGPTGSGKSTIVQLIPRLYEPERGAILIDGKPLSDYTQSSLRDQIAFVPQKPFLFFDTVAANIAFGRPFTQKQIEEASHRAHAHEFIAKLSEGYQTMVAAGGNNFSGGQQQRLAIARALVKQAPILVMDEATSSLDTLSEAQIKSALNEQRGKITQIVIAHRLSTIEDADRIVYLDQGRKLAEGTRDELLATCIPFKAMWEAHLHSRTDS